MPIYTHLRKSFSPACSKSTTPPTSATTVKPSILKKTCKLQISKQNLKRCRQISAVCHSTSSSHWRIIYWLDRVRGSSKRSVWSISGRFRSVIIRKWESRNSRKRKLRRDINWLTSEKLIKHRFRGLILNWKRTRLRKLRTVLGGWSLPRWSIGRNWATMSQVFALMTCWVQRVILTIEFLTLVS